MVQEKFVELRPELLGELSLKYMDSCNIETTVNGHPLTLVYSHVLGLNSTLAQYDFSAFPITFNNYLKHFHISNYRKVNLAFI